MSDAKRRYGNGDCQRNGSGTSRSKMQRALPTFFSFFFLHQFELRRHCQLCHKQPKRPPPYANESLEKQTQHNFREEKQKWNKITHQIDCCLLRPTEVDLNKQNQRDR